MVPLYPNSRNRVFLGECVSERVGEWASGEWASGRVSEWASGEWRVNE